MLNVYYVALDLLSALRPIVSQIQRHDPDLARQLRKASTSVPLHIAEGSFARGGNRPAKYQIAVGEARESLACCHVAERCGYIAALDERVAALFREVIGTLVVNVRRG